MEIIQKAWTDEAFSYKGEYYTVNNVSVVPKPFQQPGLPIRMAVESLDTFPLAGSLGLPIFIRHQMAMDQIKDLLGQYREAREQAGFSGPNNVILQILVYVADTEEQGINDPKASVVQAQARRSLDQLQVSSGDQETIDRQRRMREGG